MAGTPSTLGAEEGQEMEGKRAENKEGEQGVSSSSFSGISTSSSCSSSLAPELSTAGEVSGNQEIEEEERRRKLLKKMLAGGVPKDANEALVRGFDLRVFVHSAERLPHSQILTFRDLRSHVLDEIMNPSKPNSPLLARRSSVVPEGGW